MAKVDFSERPVRAQIPFESFSEWRSFAASNPEIFDTQQINHIARRIAMNGIVHPLTYKVSPPQEIEIEIPSTAYRGGIVCDKIVSRHRAALAMLARLVPEVLTNRRRFRVYAPEGITDLAQHYAKLFPLFVGSEYAPNEEVQKKIAPIVHQDLTALTYADASFDIILTQDVLEHIPDLDQGLREMCRVLAPGGWHIGVHPFLIKDEVSIRKARLSNGVVEHLMSPEYHGNPVDPEGGSLVFELPGWDILARAREAGFSCARMWLVVDEAMGVLADTCGIYVLCLQK
jgi:SAM-dependent methyltransferase